MATHDTSADIDAARYSAAPLALKDQPVQRSIVLDAARRFARNRLAMFGLLMLAVLIFVAVFADHLAPYPIEVADLSKPASELPFIDQAHPLGTDLAGRDYLTRLIYGARTSLFVGLTVPIIAFSIGVTLGALAGYRGGVADFFAQRAVEIMTAIPPLLFALLLISVVGSGVSNVIFVLGVTAWVGPTRLARAQFLTYRDREFIVAARSIGASDWRIALTHILPNAFAPLLIAFTFAVPLAIFAEAGLSFLGIGITDPTASWGKMIGSSGIGSSVTVSYHLALFPTLLVALTMLSFSFVGDGLQEALDPGRTR
jgi:oligopeptide transport system permease protein